MQTQESIYLTYQIFNLKKINKLTIYSFFILLFHINTQPANGQNLLDRLIVKINQDYFTQREVESYITVKKLITQDNNLAVDFITKENWNETLQEFIDDLIVYTEINRLGIYRARKNQIKDLLNIIHKKKEKHLQTAKFMEHLNLDDNTLTKRIETAARVANYIKNKMPNSKNTKIEHTWLVNLRKKYIVRLYKRAKIYVPIHPKAIFSTHPN